MRRIHGHHSCKQHVLQYVVHTTLGASPAQLVFGRDMLLPIQFKADPAAIHESRCQEILRSNKHEKNKRIPHEYHVGDMVSKNKPGVLPKPTTKRDGPYKVLNVYDNGTIQIQRGAITERIIIRRVQPYEE